MKIVALGPGDPASSRSRALAALRAAGPVQLDASAAAFAPCSPRTASRSSSDAPTIGRARPRRARARARHAAESRIRRARSSSASPAAQAAMELLELTETLRRECPWDRVQTAESIVPHTLEEAYEVAEAAREAGPSAKLIDELGDLLFQTTFLALLCAERGDGRLGRRRRRRHARS